LSIFAGESERYPNSLRRRDQEIKDFPQDVAALQAIENQKWAKEKKRENFMLREMIDRIRFDMDELRNAMTSAVMAGGSGISRAANSISKSLGAEVQWGMEEVSEEEEPLLEAAEEDKTVKRGLTVVSAPDPGEGTHGEDVIQTIITRKTRVGKSLSHSLCSSYPPLQKVASRVNKSEALRGIQGALRCLYLA
jgi:hypothetical protein